VLEMLLRAGVSSIVLCSYWQSYPCRRGRTGDARPRSDPLGIQVMGGLRWGGNHPVKQEVLRTSVKRICRIGTTEIESGFEERLHMDIKNVQGLKTKYDEISKKLERSNLDIVVLTETKEKTYRK